MLLRSMAEHPANIDSLKALESKIRAHMDSQDRMLDSEIGIITNANAARGVFKSGRTIKEVIRVCGTLIKNRSELTAATINKLPFSYTSNLEAALKEGVRQYFPDDLGGFQMKVHNLARKVGGDKERGEKLEDIALKEIRALQKEAIAGLLSEIDQYLVSLKHAHQFSAIDKILVFVEVASLVGAAFLFGLWVADKNGNYEPIIGMLLVVPAGLEIFRRVKAKKAT